MIDLNEAVGHGAPNRAADVRALQAGLVEIAEFMMRPRLGPGPIDGICGVGTVGAIERFQRCIGIRRPDRRVDPAGRTLLRLNAGLRIGREKLLYPFAEESEWPFVGPGAGMRAFEALRSDGERAHAGVDLYYPEATRIRAMKDGVVTRGPYPFYLKTDAVEVDHGSFLARYGELDPAARAVSEGDKVRMGDLIGKVGVLLRSDGSRLNVPSMMLHLEMYDGTETGKLTQARGTSAKSPHGIPFHRRKDLVDPSGFVSRASMG